jgi:hypothetical protein
MSRSLATLCTSLDAFVQWPDGGITFAWQLVAGTTVAVDEVFTLPGQGLMAWVLPEDVPEVCAMARVRDLRYVGEPVPF